MSYRSFEEILEKCNSENKELWQIVMEDDMSERNISEVDSMNQMRKIWQAMVFASDNYDGALHSPSGLAGGDGAKMEEYLSQHGKESLCGEYIGSCIAAALQMGESNACMKRIVAAPTAGSCGVLPAVLVPYYRNKEVTEDAMLKAMYVAAGIGQVIAYRASISGAEGGCQAEIGSASSMAAGALVYLQGGDNMQMCNAAGMAMKSLLGLVCDPVGGLVEVPCVKRNVIGTMNALSSADMSMAGIVSKIPPDQVMDAMKEIGDKMDRTLKETALGGLAQTQAALDAAKALNN